MNEQGLPPAFRDVHSPKDESELRALIETASRTQRVLRVVGAAHSVPAAIGDGGELLVSLEHMRRVVAYDRATGRITVEAGMTIGPSPLWPNRPVTETLTGYLEAAAQREQRGWALPGLGGITHQTVGGFLSTGSSGGSLQHSFADALVSIRFVDGLSQIHEVHRGEDMFDAVAVSMGLLGVITQVTLQCSEWFDIIGRETTARTTHCEVDLFGSGPNNLTNFLKSTDYARLLWFPQPGVDKVTVWQARRMTEPDYRAQNSTPLTLSARPYEALGPVGQVATDLFFSVLGRRFGHSVLDRLIEIATPYAFRAVMTLAYPVTPTNDPLLFWDFWNRGLPMDDKSSDRVPTSFTELWIPIDRAQEAMCALQNHYRDNGWAASGTYACELYGARRSPFWLSPAYGTDVLRVDVFWFEGNREDAETRYFPQFWSLLAPFEFRAHWGKALPPADSDTGARYLRERYPRWDDFMALRRKLDPNSTFATPYWRDHLGLDDAAPMGLRESMVVPSGGLREAEADELRQSG